MKKRPLLLLVLSISACSKKSDEGGRAESVKATAEKGEKAKGPLTAAVFGKTVAPPALLGKVKLGMPNAQATQAIQEANEALDVEGVYVNTGISISGVVD